MRTMPARAAVALLVVACAHAPPHPPPAAEPAEAAEEPAGKPRITFGHATMHSARGFDSFGSELVSTMTRGADGAGQTTDLTLEAREEKTVTLVTEGDEPTYRIAYGKAGMTIIHDGRLTTKVAPFAGKAYRVTVEASSAKITDDAGGHLPREEGRVIAQRFAVYQATRGGGTRLAATPLGIGERSEVIEEILKRKAAPDTENVGFGNVVATLVGVREHEGATCGVFDVQLQIARAIPGGLTLNEDLHGQLLVRTVDSAIARMELSGPCRATGTVSGVQVRAEGRSLARSEEHFE